ncbi:WD40-repeat-containing domain protein [Favolaschia claudopus]|uniref:WD40-repeat-containing domain protein n=1 Tax=Favolaschia claudopus TaxID=2862362 RepID=A0AAW0AQQ5_9AGAR
MCEIHERGLTLSLKKIEKFKPLYNLGAAFSCGLAAGAWVALVWASLFWVHPHASHRPTPWAPAVQVCHRPLQGFRVAAAEWGNGFILTHPIAPRPGRRRFKFVTAAADRRDRLIYVTSQINAARGDDPMHVDEESSDSEEEEEEFYSPGSLELLEARRRIAEYSLPRAQNRIAQQRIDSKMDLGRIVDIRKKVFGEVKKYTNLGSQIGDERPISQVRFAPNNELLVTGSWSGTVKIWNVPACTPVRSLRGHGDRVGGVAWHPQATLTQQPSLVNLASGAGDCNVHLWSLEGESPLAVMQGHQDRVCRVAFHPSGDYVASASFDTTWRLWDVNTSKELLLQEGHSKEVYSVEFQADGALVASGYQIATGSGDDTIRIWDLRSLKSLYTIPAHLSNVSDVRFFQADDRFFKPSAPPDPDDAMQEDASQDRDADADLEEWRYRSGLFFASAGYDGLVKLWSADDWQLLRTLSTDAGKVMSVDVSSDGKMLASGTYNRNFQLFSPDDIGFDIRSVNLLPWNNNNNNNNHNHHHLGGGLAFRRGRASGTRYSTLDHAQRPPLTAPKPSSKSHSRLDFITLPRRRPPLSSRAACARFRLARKKSSSSHLTIATSPTIIIHPEAELQAFATRISCKIDSLNHDLCATLSILNILDIHLRHLASSSIPSCYISDASTHILHTPQVGLATQWTVAPPETSLCALSPPSPSFLRMPSHNVTWPVTRHSFTVTVTTHAAHDSEKQEKCSH